MLLAEAIKLQTTRSFILPAWPIQREVRLAMVDTGVNLKLKTLGGLCQHKREGDVLIFLSIHKVLTTKKELWNYFQHHESLHLRGVVC